VVIQSALPSGLATRIVTQPPLDLSQDFTGYTLVSFLFDQWLNWPFVVQDAKASTQIIAYMPLLIQAALGITGA